MMQKYFSTKTQQSFAFQSLYFGLPPELLPGVFAMVPCTEHRGLFYAGGGMIQIPLALQRCGERCGMEVRLNTRVQKVLVENRRAYGVKLSDGTEITSRLVVSNVNSKLLYLNMIDEEQLPWLVRQGVKSYDYSMAVPMVFLGVDYRPPLDAHHTLISPTVEEINTYWKHRAERPIPEKQFGLIGWSTFTDPSMAPKGKHALNLTMTGTYHLNGTTWDALKPSFIQNVITQLSSTVVPGLAEHVEVATAITPLDFERRVGIAEGAIYGLAQDFPTETVFRPANKSKAIQGLYLAGSSTQPRRRRSNDDRLRGDRRETDREVRTIRRRRRPCTQSSQVSEFSGMVVPWRVLCDLRLVPGAAVLETTLSQQHPPAGPLSPSALPGLSL